MAKTKLEVDNCYTDRHGTDCIRLSRNRGKITQRDVYEWSEANRNTTDGNAYLAFLPTYDSCQEVPDFLYEEGDEMLVYNLYEAADDLIKLAIQRYAWMPSIELAKTLDKLIEPLRKYWEGDNQ